MGNNLLTVLGVSSVSAAMSALHSICAGSKYAKLNVGMYLGLPNFTVSGTNYGTQRIVIAGFDTFKDLGGYTTDNHILFAFKNTVLNKEMNVSSNVGGYHSSTMKTFLDGDFKTGLINSIGSYIYDINRNLSDKGSFSWHSYGVWLPTEYEVFGSHTYSESQSGDIVKIPLYTEYSDYRKKTGSDDYWWLSSPYASTSYYFCYVDSSGSVDSGDATNSYGVSPCFAKKAARRDL